VPRNSKTAKKQRNSSPRRSSATRVRRGRPKVCIFCSQQTTWVDYKDVNVLRRFLSDRGKIKSRASTGNCAQHQRDVAVAIKTGRELALLPYAVRTVASDPGERRGRRPRPSSPGSAEATTQPASTDTVPSPDELDGAEQVSEGDAELPQGSEEPPTE
jgi:small subunit ribosomal protein S18